MPLYEFLCRDCAHPFEAIVASSEAARCPACGGARLDKQFSAFAVGGSAPAFRTAPPASGACGSCGDPRGPGSCARD